MNCIICGQEIEPGRGGSYCMRCAGLHATYSWDQVKEIREQENKTRQTELYDYENTVTEMNMSISDPEKIVKDDSYQTIRFTKRRIRELLQKMRKYKAKETIV